VPAVEQTEGRPKIRVGKYTITGRLGRGGMGMVYRGYDEVLEREVAVKTLRIEGTFDEESRRRFEIEAKAAARLQHPNILTVFELGEDRGVPFIAMELLPGVDLETLVRSGEPLVLTEKLDIVVQVCRGLAYAHEHKIVHRDIKPSNIRLLDDGTAKIMDFGIAKLAGTSLTKSGMMIGTVHYMSPEQVRARPLDGRSDVFSVGVILYDLLAGRRPFVGEDATQVLFGIVNTEPPPLGADLGEEGEHLEAIVARSLSKDPADRQPTANHLADELAEVLASLRRSGSATLSPAEQEVLSSARRLLKDGRAADSATQLRDIVSRHPDSLEARRALRAATRQEARPEGRPEEAVTEAFPELEATFQSPPTTSQPETKVQPTVAYTAVDTPTALRAPSPNGKLLAGAAAFLVVAVGAAAVLLHRSGPVSEDHPVSSVTTTLREAKVEPLQPSLPTLSVVSDPSGAQVSVDGRVLSGTTPLSLPLDPKSAHVLVLTHDGFTPREVRVAAGALPPEVRLTLDAAAPPGVVAVTSSYPVDVVWNGKTLSKAEVSPRVSVPSGRQTLTLVSATYLLKANVTVDVRTGVESAVSAPPLGRISIKAAPDNCEVFIDGVFVDYPPIIERVLAAGSRTVAFKWSDGTRREEHAEVPRDGLVYVTGRKD
jgi:serine/threonine protein kinase